MRISILIPHLGTGKMTSYAIAQLLKFKGKHEIEIIVIDNNTLDGSVKYLFPFKDSIKYVTYPKGMLQSHGIAFDYALYLGYVSNEYFITMESDAFPTNNSWLDYIEELILSGCDMGGSLLSLSGGKYVHGCGAFYKKSNWIKCKYYCDEIQYHYFPNMYYHGGFDCHLMIHDSILNEVLESPDDWIELANNYKGLSKSEMLAKRDYYRPVVNPFHNGMGMLQESLQTYGQRSAETEVPNIILNNKVKLIKRIGYEPSQFFYYWHCAMGKKIALMPTDIQWMEGRENRQQEYTQTYNGVKHLWGISAYKDVDPNDEVAKVKQALPEQLYEVLPEHQKIKIWVTE